MFYFKKGDSIGQLNIYVNNTDIIWTLNGDQDDNWRLASITINSITDYYISIEGVVGSSFNG